MKRFIAAISCILGAAVVWAGTVGTPPQRTEEGRYYLAVGDYEEAIARCDDALAAEPAYVDAWLVKAAAYVYLCAYNKSLACYEKAAALDPDEAQAWAGQGDILRYLERPEEALAYYDKGLALAPGYPDYLAGKGDALIEAGFYEEGMAALAAAAELGPAEWTYYYRGLGALGRGRYADAAAAFASVTAMSDSLFIYSCLLLYITKASAGDAAAREALAPVLAWPTRLWPRAVARLYAGEATPAEVLAAAGDDRIKQCEAFCFLGYYYKFAGDAKAARSYFKKAIKSGVRHDMEYRLAKRELAG